MRLYSVSYQTESGDSGFIGIFDRKPDEGHLSAIALRDFPDEIIDEDGDVSSLIYFHVNTVEGIGTLPPPVEPISGICGC